MFWSRPDCLRLDPDSITLEKIACARMLHIDGHDTPAVRKPRELARELHIPVSVRCRHYLSRASIACSRPSITWWRAPNFPSHWTKERDPFRALEMIQNEYGMSVAAMTLGAHGALARVRGQVHLLARVRGELRRYHRRRRRVSRGVLLCCARGDADARDARIFERDGRAELHQVRRARRTSRRSIEARALIERGERRANQDFARSRASRMIPLRSTERVYARRDRHRLPDRDQHADVSVPGDAAVRADLNQLIATMGHRAGSSGRFISRRCSPPCFCMADGCT